MKKNFLIFFVVIIALVMSVLASCSERLDLGEYPDPQEGLSGDEYREIRENPFVSVADAPVSYFSMDSNTAAYANIRSYINSNRLPGKDQVKIDEMINYFHYDYPEPETGEDFSITTSIIDAPWNDQHKLLSVGIRTKDIDFSGRKPSNLVFLLDTSGSMAEPNKLGLVKNAFTMLTENLTENDRISIVTYAGASNVLLSGESGDNKNKIISVINSLEASGSTAGARGIQTAYQIANQNFINGGINRVLLATDGDFNIGISSESELKTFIEGYADSGIYLTVMGFGYGNYKDNKLSTLAQYGQGNAYYIDSVLEAKKVLVDGLGGTLETVAKDVKASVQFNPNFVNKYRLIGYENKLLTAEDWEDPEADAGEIGAGHTTTVVYELGLQEQPGNAETDLGQNYLKVSLRYKEPVEQNGSNYERNVYVDQSAYIQSPSYDSIFVTCIIESALIMRDSPYKGNANLDNVINRLNDLPASYFDEFKTEFKNLIFKYKQLLNNQ